MLRAGVKTGWGPLNGLRLLGTNGESKENPQETGLD